MIIRAGMKNRIPTRVSYRIFGLGWGGGGDVVCGIACLMKT